jgi:hypothetical protein
MAGAGIDPSQDGQSGISEICSQRASSQQALHAASCHGTRMSRLYMYSED